MSTGAALVLLIHYGLVFILCVYGAHRIYHSYIAKSLFARAECVPDYADISAEHLPHVTVQAPMFNEKFVAARIIDAITAFDYPKNKLQIQVIDDSTDESVDIAAERVAYYKARGFNIEHIHRDMRQGYKAGALADAMPAVKGEFIAIFDADFIPHPDFLLKTLPCFSDPKVGLVQTRWTYLNSRKNRLTRVQSVMLDAHFGIEQVVRFGQGAFFNFNGTAGIWRRTTIDDAGGWRSDTLTEDTDLSYRAQLKGWEFIYRPDIECPSEIPETMSAFKVQQHRWAKGAIEVMRKLLPTIWRADIPPRSKIEATFHLTGNLSYLLMFIDSLFFLLPTVHIRQQMAPNVLIWLDLPIFVFASLSHAWFFLSSQSRLYGKVMNKLTIMPTLLATSIGLGVNNGCAVIEALLGYKTGFVRTPKTGGSSSRLSLNSSSLANIYQSHSRLWTNAVEIMLGVIYTGFLIWAIVKAYWVVTPFLLLFAAGFFYTGLLSFWEQRQSESDIAGTTSIDPIEARMPHSGVPSPGYKERPDILVVAE